MSDERLRILFIAGKPVDLSQRRKVLMTIQLPNNFLVTGQLSIVQQTVGKSLPQRV